MPRISLFCLLAVLLCPALCVPHGALAQPAAAESSRYRAIIREAVAEFSAGRWEEARALFTKAHRINPSARTLRGLGMTAFELRNYVEARQMLSQAMQSKVLPLTEVQRTHTQHLLERTNAFIGVYTIHAPIGTSLLVDGQPPDLDNEGRLLMNGGRHMVTASLQGYANQIQQVDVRGGEVGVLPFNFTTPATPGARSAGGSTGMGGAQAVAASYPTPAPRRPQATELWPWLLVGGGGVLVGASLVTGLMAKGALNKVDDACSDTPDACPSRFESDADRASSMAMMTDVLWVSGLLLAGGGGAWLLLSSSDSDSPNGAQSQLELGPASLRLRGTF